MEGAIDLQEGDGKVRIAQEPLLDFIATPDTQLVVPTYQRPYSWKADQCLELWLDIQRAARRERPHFAGTILYATEPGERRTVRRSVIDGQQRVTTLSLLLAALCQHLHEQGLAVGGQDAAAIARRYLAQEDALAAAGPSEVARPAGREAPCAPAGGHAPCRLLLSPRDASTFAALVASLPEAPDPASLPAPRAARLLESLAFFRAQMAEPGFDAELLWRGIGLLTVIDAELDDPDQAQAVFESLNSKGRPLTVADLVRNYLLLAESPGEQQRLHQEYWQPMEGLFAPDPGSLRLDSAIKGWLSVRFRKTRMRSPELVYSGFKRYVEDVYDGTKEDLLRELRGFCLMWAENYRFHAVKKYRSAFSWAINGAPTLTAGYALRPADDEAYAERVRAELRSADGRF